MKIKGTTKIFGVVGNPVSHSFSPMLHNFLFEKLNMDNVYLPFEVEKGSFKKFISGMKKINNLIGLNITVPFKNDALKVCDELSDDAKIIGSVNTLHFKNNKLYGYNTDSFGFLESLKINFPDFEISEKDVFVLGAGGAAKAILFSLIKSNVNKIFLANRTVKKAEQLKKYFEKNTGFKNIVISEFNDNNINNMDIIINTTSVGLKLEDKLLISIPERNKIRLVYDIIYNPKTTKLLSDAKSKGIDVVNGKDMLILQALKSFEIWTGIDVIPFLKEIRSFL